MEGIGVFWAWKRGLGFRDSLCLEALYVSFCVDGGARYKGKLLAEWQDFVCGASSFIYPRKYE